MNKFVAFRLALLGVLLIALWNPGVPWTREPVHLIVVLDESLSVTPYFTGQDWLTITHLTRELAPGSRFSLIRYGSEPVVEVAAQPIAAGTQKILAESEWPPRRHTFDRSGTNTEVALRAALRLSYTNERPIILLVTDGNDSDGDVVAELRLAKDAGIPVHLFDVRRGKTVRDAWIEDMLVPERTRLDKRIPLTATVGSSVAQQAQLKVLVDGRSVSETQVSLSPERPARLEVWVTLAEPGVHEVAVVIEAGQDELTENDSRRKLVAIEPYRPIIYVTRNETASPVARSLTKGGWAVHTIHPAQFLNQFGQLRTKAAIVLDDIAIGDMTERAWERLAQAVRGEGTGLIVLGGPNSFSAGSYRHSALEALLPVTAESGDPRERAAVLFMVDKSGSMDRDERGASRFAYARESVLETVRALAGSDMAGLMWFDVVPREALSLAAHDNFAQQVRRAWTAQPGGGTVLAPALHNAIHQLGGAQAERRFLVVVTDGFLSSPEKLQSLEQQVETAGIDVISLVIGGNQDVEPLRRLSALNEGVLLRVDRIATLPRIMRQQVERRRNPVHRDPVVPQVRTPLPNLPEIGEWPVMSGYMVTKARPSAFVHLQSQGGDPLLAMHHVGAARVVALPGGLGRWAETWPNWPSWGRFIGGLLDWVATRDQNPLLDARVVDRPGRLEVVVDAVSPDFDWLSSATAKVTVQDHAMQTRESPLIEVAPGHYTGSVAVSKEGRYRAVVRIGDETMRRDVLHTSTHEFVPGGQTGNSITELERQGLIKPWSPESSLVLEDNTDGQASLRSLLLPFLVPLYLLLIALERTGLRVRFRMGRVLDTLRRLRWPAVVRN